MRIPSTRAGKLRLPSTSRADSESEARNSSTWHSGSPESLVPITDWKLFEAMAIPGENASYLLVDGTGDVLEATRDSENIWGASADGLKGQSILSLLDNGEQTLDWLFNTDLSTREELFRGQAKLPAGSTIYLRLKSIPLFVSQEPSQSRAALKAVPMAQSKATKAVPHSGSCSSMHTREGRFLSANTFWKDQLGFELESLKEKTLEDIVHIDDQRIIQDFIKRVAHGTGPTNAIFRIHSQSHQIKTLLATGRVDPNSTSIVVNAKNITLERDHPAMDLLQVSIELINESVLILMKVGKGYRICYANKACEEMTGYAISRLAGSHLSYLNGPDTDFKVAKELEQAMSDEIECEKEIMLYRKDKKPFWSRTHLCPMRDNKGRANYYIAIFEDATDVKKAAEELKKKNDELQGALLDLKETQRTIIQQENLRALGQMASGIAHDFNNLLAPILGFSELLLKIPASDRNEEKLVAYLKKIQVAAKDGAAVVGRLKDFYRSQAGPEEFTRIDPREIVDEAKELTRHRWKTQAEASGLDIEFQSHLACSRYVMGNESELRQALTNLIINAVDAMKENGTISVHVEDIGDFVRIQVKDTGMGMPESVKAKCLDPFFSTKGNLGTGLGLSIVFGMIQRHEGHFDIDTIEGSGTCITIELPAYDAIEEKEEIVETSSEQKTLRIMLVDDEEVLLEVISELLASSGHSVFNFSDPQDALRAFETDSFDLVITDRAMPAMSGDQFAAAIKEIRSDTPVFMVTGFGDLIRETGENPKNVDEVLGKPVPLDLLNRKLAELSGKMN